MQVDKPAYITLLTIGTDGSVAVLFPNDFAKASQIAAPGMLYQVPAVGAPFRITEQGPAGKNLVMAIATSKPLDLTAFNPTTIPNFGGIRSVGKTVDFASQLRNLVVQSAGAGTTDDAWGSTFLLIPVIP